MPTQEKDLVGCTMGSVCVQTSNIPFELGPVVLRFVQQTESGWHLSRERTISLTQ